MRITVGFPDRSQTTIPVQASDAVLSVKVALFNKVSHVPRPLRQILVFDGIHLADDRLLSECHIRDGARLKLLLKDGPAAFELRVHSFDSSYGNKETRFKVEASDSISSVKVQIQQNHEGHPPPAAQVLVFEGVILEDYNSLADYGFKGFRGYERNISLSIASSNLHDHELPLATEITRSNISESPVASSWNPIIFELLCGVYSVSSPLRAFQRDSDSFRLIVAVLKESWRNEINWKTPGFHVPMYNTDPLPPPLVDSNGQLVSLNINMMPFVMGHTNTLPDNCKRYAKLIDACIRRVSHEEDKVGYLTVQESWVEPGNTQRRPGLHVETPGILKLGSTFKPIMVHWGWGSTDRNLVPSGSADITGGIFMASSIPDSCAIWPCVIDNVSNAGVDSLGSMEHLRAALERASKDQDDAEVFLQPANRLVWITDRTPHESLPVKRRVFRQYFRLVTSNVNVWYADHSTPNPLGVLPSCQVIKGNKFSGTQMSIVQP
ncbi:hypothetical protein HK100_005816 [Physocladia obscura]|uniref:Ubiquitin-like domain-containing protein n=1 Tax=Physocladia obscura TaxID=109957 RepID=A0AAD5XKP4_9FUNG|nr:hypothetical protein HK100_005816 [Physocladia obscura]